MTSTGNTREQGRLAEDLALSFLLNKEYELLARNYRYKKSEIDIILQLELILVFVEVKFRSSDKYGHPEDFVSANQQRTIIEGADYYLNQIQWPGQIRFDIIAVNSRNEITHFEDAFY